MGFLSGVEERSQTPLTRVVSLLGRVLLAVGIPAIAFYVLYLGFLFLRDSDAPRGVIALVAIIWGVGGVALLFWIFNSIVESLSDEWTARLQPFVFVAIGISHSHLVSGFTSGTYILD